MFTLDNNIKEIVNELKLPNALWKLFVIYYKYSFIYIMNKIFNFQFIGYRLFTLILKDICMLTY